MSKTPEELAAEWYWQNLTDQPSEVLLSNPPKYPADPRKAFLAGYQAAQEQATENSASITLKDILGMTIEEYLFKHSEEIAEEVLNNNPLLKALKDEQDT
jgi:hypothetical protein